MKEKTVNKQFKIDGMHCAGCSAAVERALKRVPGVTEAVVNLTTESARVIYDPILVPEDAFEKAVDAAGYSLRQEEKETEEDTEAELSRDKRKVREAKNRLLLAWGLTIPIILWMIPEMFFGYYFLGHWGHTLGMFLLSLGVLLVPGKETLVGAYKSTIHGSPSMDALIALGTLAALTTGILAILNMAGLAPAFHNFSGIAGMIMAFHLTGRYLETKARGRASSAIKKLLTLGAKEATIQRDGIEIKIPVKDLKVGDIMVIRPGEKIPTDGRILEGSCEMDESLVTGESMPIQKTKGDSVTGGTINLNGLIKAEATKVGKDTFLNQVIRMVEEAQTSKVPIQAFADRITAVFVPIVMLLALSTFLIWYLFPDLLRPVILWAATFIPWIDPALGRGAMALSAAIAVLVIACPCALGLATPTALVVGSGKGAEKGILIRKGSAIQILKQVDTLFLDKTGTITEGKPGVTDLIPGAGYSERQLLSFAGGLESASEHPLAKAVVEYAKETETPLPGNGNFKAVPGKGVQGLVGGREVLVGTQDFLGSQGIDLKENDLLQAEKLESQAKTVLFTAVQGEFAGLIALRDTLKPDSKEAINSLRQEGLRIIMLSGDNERTARAVAEEVGIEEVIFRVLPQQKAGIIQKEREKGSVVAMVGDGINDAPALASADVGIALGTGTDIAIESGDLVLTQGSLTGVLRSIILSRATFRKIKQNLFWAFFYNVVMIPLGILGMMHPVLAEIAMAMSSLNVVTNSRRLNRVKL